MAVKPVIDVISHSCPQLIKLYSSQKHLKLHLTQLIPNARGACIQHDEQVLKNITRKN